MLSYQRNIKRQESKEPIVQMTKSDIEEQRLGKFVIMPAHFKLSFKKWWRTRAPSDTVDFRYPHEKHGTKTREKFLEFVDSNTQPNGRSADSKGPTHYFLPSLLQSKHPRFDVTHYEERLARLIVEEFNRVQLESGEDECSNSSSHNWLKAHRPKVGSCLHQEDYCDTYSRRKAEIRAK